MYKICIFDLDGTLTDTLESLTYSVNTTLAEMKLLPITHEQCKAFVGNGARFLMERALEAAGDEKKLRIDEAMGIYGRVFQENCTYRVAPYQGILEMLQGLKAHGICLAVLSNKPHLQALDVVNQFFPEGTFSYVQGQKEGIPRKPDPTAALMIAKQFGAQAEECVYIGDSDVDMVTGKAAGMLTVGVTWGFRSEDVLKEHGTDCLIDHPTELLSIVE